MNDALSSTVPGALAFATHACADASRRRRRLLQASSIIVTTDATVRDAAYADGASKSDIADGAQSAVAESAASGALGAAIIDAAAALDPTSPLRAVTLSVTLPPTPTPTLAPSSALEVDDDDDSAQSVVQWVVIAVVLLVLAIGIASVAFMVGKGAAAEERSGSYEAGARVAPAPVVNPHRPVIELVPTNVQVERITK